MRLLETLEPRTLLSALTFAVIGDFGSGSANEQAVADVITAANPDLIITTGDNNYPVGSAATIDRNIGFYYHDFIYPYTGAYGPGPADDANHFFPTLGNHDYFTPNAQPYFDYFALPGNERYYTFSAGPVQFFAIDSDSHEPDLHYLDKNTSTADSPEALWLRDALAASTATWKIVYFHEPPYSSGVIHGSSPYMRWPFKDWGATAVLAGHEHHYERLLIDDLPYFVQGAGGDSLYPFSATPIDGSQFRYNSTYGAIIVEATDTDLTFRFIDTTNTTIDSYALHTDPPPVEPPPVEPPPVDPPPVNPPPINPPPVNPPPARPPCPPATPPYVAHPIIVTPARLRAIPMSRNRIRLAWSDTSSAETGFLIERSLDGQHFRRIATLPANTTRFTDIHLSPKHRYHYRIRALHQKQKSSPTPAISILPLRTP